MSNRTIKWRHARSFVLMIGWTTAIFMQAQRFWSSDSDLEKILCQSGFKTVLNWNNCNSWDLLVLLKLDLLKTLKMDLRLSWIDTAISKLWSFNWRRFYNEVNNLNTNFEISCRHHNGLGTKHESKSKIIFFDLDILPENFYYIHFQGNGWTPFTVWKDQHHREISAWPSYICLYGIQ